MAFLYLAEENFKGVTEDILNSAFDGLLIIGGIVAAVVVLVMLYRGRVKGSDREDGES